MSHYRPIPALLNLRRPPTPPPRGYQWHETIIGNLVPVNYIPDFSFILYARPFGGWQHVPTYIRKAYFNKYSINETSFIIACFIFLNKLSISSTINVLLSTYRNGMSNLLVQGINDYIKLFTDSSEARSLYHSYNCYQRCYQYLSGSIYRSDDRELFYLTEAAEALGTDFNPSQEESQDILELEGEFNQYIINHSEILDSIAALADDDEQF